LCGIAREESGTVSGWEEGKWGRFSNPPKQLSTPLGTSP
jgi:hypothetical protein